MLWNHDDYEYDDDDDGVEGIWEAGGGRRQLSLYKQAALGGKPTLPAFYDDHDDKDDVGLVSKAI